MGLQTSRRETEQIELEDLSTRNFSERLARRYNNRDPFDFKNIIRRIDEGHTDLWEIIRLIHNNDFTPKSKYIRADWHKGLRDVVYLENLSSDEKRQVYSDRDGMVSFYDLHRWIKQILAILYLMKIDLKTQGVPYRVMDELAQYLYFFANRGYCEGSLAESNLFDDCSFWLISRDHPIFKINRCEY